MKMISIAMATYNGEKYLREQLDSILNQTVQDFELIVCDDCSTDSSLEILREYEKADGRIKVFVNEKNLGFKKNFERVAGLCSGEYIAFSDQDDIWLPEHLEKLLSIIGENDVACGNALMVDKNGKSMEKKLNEVDDFFIFDSEMAHLRMLFKSGPFQGASMLLSSQFVKRHLPFPDGIFAPDTWLACCACLERGLSYTFDCISKYRQHGDNVTFLGHNRKRRNVFEKFMSYLNHFFRGIQVDRFCYCEALLNEYGKDDERLLEVYRILLPSNNKCRAERVRMDLRTLKFFWKNYEAIMTRKGHKGFLKNLVIWSRWRREERA